MMEGDAALAIHKRRGSSLEHGSGRKDQNRKKQKHSQPTDDEVLFPVLDLKNPEHAHRYQQRLKAISKGKNTPGYASYIHSVPKEHRRRRSMKTPATPNASLNIPNKRWQGMMKAWRRALHAYDPKDLTTAFEASSPTSTADAPAVCVHNNASKKLGTPQKNPETEMWDEQATGSPVSVFSEDGCSARRELEFEEELRAQGCDGDDSDDDLL